MRTYTSIPENEEPQPSTENFQPVASVSRALRVLRCFTVDTPELGVSEIARTLGIHKSTVHRLLATLEHEGFIRQVEGGRYMLSVAVLELSAAVTAWESIRETVLASLRKLAEHTGETAHLAVLDTEEVLYVEKVEGKWSLRMPSSVGKRLPLNCTALGKVFLAGLEPDASHRIIHGRRWEARTPNTLTDPYKLEAEIDAVRNRGYAMDREEVEEGLACIAAPVTDDRGITSAAISISAPSPRLMTRLEERIGAVQETSRSLSRLLGADARRLREATHIT
ncbi:IclR family transcriptional regulator [Arthrobacter sp. GCM10027362]|uniref:IclR family transcriptional regulator n=1 Tax=Arthrobacter sp. GCM10027362 TaxID=3273379 RepID=UPI00366B1BAA